MVDVDLSCKTALITGVNSGLGLKTLQFLAQHGVRVLGTARTLQKARIACASVGARATPFELELADFDSVVACADAVNQLGTPIDMLICNAGVMGIPELEQAHGIEKHLAVNHLGHFIFVNRLLNRVREAQQGRVVVLSSLAWEWAPPEGIQFDNLSGERDYQSLKSYGQSKLANALFSFELAQRLEGWSATSIAIHPGIVQTNLMRNIPKNKWWPFTDSVETAAANICTVAAMPQFVNFSGAFFANRQVLIPRGHIGNRKMATKLWQASADIVRKYIA